MIQPATLPLRAARWTPFVYVIAIEGIDLSLATFNAQVRLTPDTPGDPLVDLVNASSSAQGVSCEVVTSGGVTTSYVQLRINETTMEGLPAAGEVGADLDLAWDLQVTRSGNPKSVYYQGPFTVVAGVTH